MYMSKEEKAPYLDNPKKNKKDDVKETLIYNGETLEEVEKRKKEYKDKKLNE